LDAETCAAYSDLESYLINCRDLNNYEDTDFDYRNNNAFKNDTVKKIGYNLIKNNGYIKQDSIVQFVHNYKKDKYATKDEPANDEDIKKIDAWVNEKDKQTDYSNTYMTNAITAWKEEYIEYRDLALVLSLINSYFKDIQEQERNKHNSISTNYVGNIGDKVTLKIASYRFLYQKNNDTYSYYALPTSIYQVIDDKGNTFIVETSKESIDDDWINRTIEGKVKAQKEYKGIKQTIINRIKLLNETLSISEALKFLK
jgi:hypothetical protein